MFKSQEENPNGLHHKYIISRTDGTPINPDNEYFLLKVKGEGDPKHIEACQIALLAYAGAIQEHLPKLADDIFEKYPDFNIKRVVEYKHFQYIDQAVSWINKNINKIEVISVVESGIRSEGFHVVYFKNLENISIKE